MMNIKGITYPGRDIQAWLAQADITHISNETSFYEWMPSAGDGLDRLEILQ